MPRQEKLIGGGGGALGETGRWNHRRFEVDGFLLVRDDAHTHTLGSATRCSCPCPLGQGPDI